MFPGRSSLLLVVVVLSRLPIPIPIPIPSGTTDGCSRTAPPQRDWPRGLEEEAHVPASAEQSGAEPSWAAVQPDIKLFYFGPP